MKIPSNIRYSDREVLTFSLPTRREFNLFDKNRYDENLSCIYFEIELQTRGKVKEVNFMIISRRSTMEV